MNVLVIGANGAIGQMITATMEASPDFTPTAFIRKEGQRAVFEAKGIATRVASLEGLGDDIAATMEGQHAIIFTAGSGAKTGPDKTLTVDLDGAVKAMDAALNMNVKRFVMVSALRADDREAWETSSIKPYFVAKHYADRILKGMDLEYTILRPGRLLDVPGTGKIDIKNPTARKGVPREDVAAVAVAVLQYENTIGQVIEFNEGEDAIPEILSGI